MIELLDKIYLFLIVIKEKNMYCTKCGKELQEDTKFCPSCGAENSKKENTGETFTEQAGAFFDKVKDTVNNDLNVNEVKKWGVPRILFLISGILLFLSTFTPLFSVHTRYFVKYGQSFNMFQTNGFLGFVTLVGGCLAIAGAFAINKGLKIAALVISIIMTIVWICIVAGGASSLAGSLLGVVGAISVGFGFVANLIGLGLLIAGFVMDKKNK